MNLTLYVWRQKDSLQPGAMERHEAGEAVVGQPVVAVRLVRQGGGVRAHMLFEFGVLPRRRQAHRPSRGVDFNCDLHALFAFGRHFACTAGYPGRPHVQRSFHR